MSVFVDNKPTIANITTTCVSGGSPAAMKVTTNSSNSAAATAVADCEGEEEDGPVYQFRRIGSSATCRGVKDEFKVSNCTTKIGRQLDEVDFYLNSTVNKRLISRQHAQLERIHDGKQWRFILIDTSLNGTYVNDVKVSGQTELKVGDTVTFGHTNGINVRDGMVAWQPNSEFRFVFECVFSQGRPNAATVKKTASQVSSVSSAEVNPHAGTANIQTTPNQAAQHFRSDNNVAASLKTESQQPPALPTRHSAMDSIKQAFSEAAVDRVAALSGVCSTGTASGWAGDDLMSKNLVPPSASLAATAHWLSEKYGTNQKSVAASHGLLGGGGDLSNLTSKSILQQSGGSELLTSSSQKSPSRSQNQNNPSSRSSPAKSSNVRAAVSSGGNTMHGDVYDFVETDEQKREQKVVKKVAPHSTLQTTPHSTLNNSNLGTTTPNLAAPHSFSQSHHTQQQQQSQPFSVHNNYHHQHHHNHSQNTLSSSDAINAVVTAVSHTAQALQQQQQQHSINPTPSLPPSSHLSVNNNHHTLNSSSAAVVSTNSASSTCTFIPAYVSKPIAPVGMQNAAATVLPDSTHSLQQQQSIQSASQSLGNINHVNNSSSTPHKYSDTPQLANSNQSLQLNQSLKTTSPRGGGGGDTTTHAAVAPVQQIKTESAPATGIVIGSRVNSSGGNNASLMF